MGGAVLPLNRRSLIATLLTALCGWISSKPTRGISISPEHQQALENLAAAQPKDRWIDVTDDYIEPINRLKTLTGPYDYANPMHFNEDLP